MVFNNSREQSNIYKNKPKESIDIYKSKKDFKKIGFDVFNSWYSMQEKCCAYCGLTALESLQLYFRFPESTRGGKRGKRLELDRRDSSIKDYSKLENLILACYWCNNAKTNYFTYDEFMIIGKAIKNIQKSRLIK